MLDVAFFIEIAQQQGYGMRQAQRVLSQITAQLRSRCNSNGFGMPIAYYIFRTGGEGGEGGEGGGGSGRPRILLAFPSADAALGFAQINHLGAAPRLIQLSIARLLAILIQRPAIPALLFADEPEESFTVNTLPQGLRLERSTLLDLLKEENV